MENKTVSNQRLIGAMLLIAGSCIGAGMLGLPVLTAQGGFQPTCLFFVLSWLFMLISGLLLLEVNLWFKEDVSFVTMAGQTLGIFGKAAAWILFAFLFYTLMVAYVVGSGQILSDFFAVKEWQAQLGITVVFGVFLYLGTSVVDNFNRLLMLGLILSYAVFMVTGLPHVNVQNLQHADWSAAALAVPAMIISFGFHNLVPSMTSYLEHDAKKIRIAIVYGSAIPLVIYLFWEWLTLGLINFESFQEAFDQGEMVTRALRNEIGVSWIVDVVEYFAFFAIVTSFLGVALSFVDFLSDGLGIKKTAMGKIVLCFLSLTPPYVLAIYNPQIFLSALIFAGAYGAVILFGVLPAMMVWSGRYIKKMKGESQIPGGKFTPILIFILSLIIAGFTLWS